MVKLIGKPSIDHHTLSALLKSLDGKDATKFLNGVRLADGLKTGYLLAAFFYECKTVSDARKHIAPVLKLLHYSYMVNMDDYTYALFQQHTGTDYLALSDERGQNMVMVQGSLDNWFTFVNRVCVPGMDIKIKAFGTYVYDTLYLEGYGFIWEQSKRTRVNNLLEIKNA